MGVTQTDKVFLSRNNRGECVRSAREPSAKVAIATDKPIIVRYWKCHPYDSLLHFAAVRLSERGLVPIFGGGRDIHWAGKIQQAIQKVSSAHEMVFAERERREI